MLPRMGLCAAKASIAEDAGHFVHYETPDTAAAEVDRFFRRIGYK